MKYDRFFYHVKKILFSNTWQSTTVTALTAEVMTTKPFLNVLIFYFIRIIGNGLTAHQFGMSNNMDLLRDYIKHYEGNSDKTIADRILVTVNNKRV